MKNSHRFRSLFIAVVFLTNSVAFTSCDDASADASAGAYAQDAVFISNEGSYNNSNASVSYYNRSTGQVENNIFSKQNAALVLGDVLQSISVLDDRAFLVVNNSQKMVVVNANTFKAEGEVNGLVMPRYFAALNNDKGYITEWVTYSGNGRVSVVDLNTLTVTKTIEVGLNPEKLLVAAGKVYVANSGGKTISVINTATDELEATIEVNDGPNSLATDRNNNLWVASSGQKAYNPDYSVSEEGSQPGTLTRIDQATNTVASTFTFSQKAPAPTQLSSNGNHDKLYYVYNRKVYQLDVNASDLNTTPLIDRGDYIEYGWYGFGVDPKTGYIYGGKAPDFTSNGWVVRFNPSGAPVDSFAVGIAPNGFAFR
ncbi:DUF5074 domain-containing protein [Pontibacter chitinilyticus]|uniref:DUF5074 domain-containing protein n=1 Tax=Pontibacter chitinilyticus TaxID=2674989 RepID=UPI0032193A1F